MTTQSERRYRCSECGRTDGLTAISYGYMIGTLSADGTGLDDYSLAVEDTELCEETIECPDHTGAAIERLVDGIWTVSAPCPGPPAEYKERRGDAYECRQGVLCYYGSQAGRCPTCEGRGQVNVPVEGAERVG